MMSDREGLLASIRAHPDDDQPRLVFADWLDEHGESERAEFIRAQCAIANLNRELHSDEDCESPDCLGCNERLALEARCQAFWKIVGHEYWFNSRQYWLKSASGLLCVDWSRGFIERLTGSHKSLLVYGPGIAKEHVVRSVVSHEILSPLVSRVARDAINAELLKAITRGL